MGTISVEQRRLLRLGMSTEELRALLGPPTKALEPREIVTPSQVFRELGSRFGFGEENIDTVWTYSDKKRPRLVYCLGIEDGHLVSIWRLTTKRS